MYLAQGQVNYTLGLRKVSLFREEVGLERVRRISRFRNMWTPQVCSGLREEHGKDMRLRGANILSFQGQRARVEE